MAACLAAPASAGIFPPPAFSDKAAGTTAISLLKSPPSAHLDGVGGAYVAGVDGSEALFHNPAGTASLEESDRWDLSAGYELMLETAYGSSLGLARPVAGIGVFGLGLLYASQSSQQGYSSVGDPSGSFRPFDFAASVSYAKRLEALRLGGALKALHSQVSDLSGTSFAVDLGLQYLGALTTVEGPIDLGAAVTNLGPAMKIGGASDPLPFKLQAGARWHLSERVAGMLDFFFPVDQGPYFALGLEGRFPLGGEIAASLRGGYNIARTRGVDGFSGMSAGLGLEWARLRLDYAWVPYGDLGSTNRVSFGYAF